MTFDEMRKAHRQLSLQISARHKPGRWCGTNQCCHCAQAKTARRAVRHFDRPLTHKRGKCPVCRSGQHDELTWRWAWGVWVRWLEDRVHAK